MPGLRFPRSELLQFAIRQGLLPPETAAIPVAGGTLDDGSVALFWHELPRKANVEPLEAIGAVRFVTPPKGIRPLSSPAEAIPLGPLPSSDGDDASSQVGATLFEFATAEGFAGAAGELLRLGSDALGFALVRENRTGRERRFLRAVRPSYFVVQRAAEGDFGPVAIRSERGARLWAPLAMRHPLEDLLSPPLGTWMLLSEEGPWETIEEPDFSDLYDVIELATPRERETLTSIEPPRLRTPIRLVESGAREAAEFWTFRGGAIERLHRFVQDHEQALAGRLAFAVTDEPDPTVVLRTRPGHDVAPTIGIEAIGYRSYLRIPNLFVPCGMQLRPRLRPDAIATRLAPRQDETTWLEPLGEEGFVPRTIPESAFRDLESWIEYYLEREEEALSVWTRAMTFDFEPFVCRDDPEQGKPPKRYEPAPPPRRSTFDEIVESEVASRRARTPKRNVEREQPGAGERFAVDLDRDRALRRLHELEEAFTAFRSPPDSEERRAVWSEMAQVHFALGRPHDALVCWTAGAWRSDDPSADEIEALSRGLASDLDVASLAAAKTNDDRIADAEQARTLAAAAIVAGSDAPSSAKELLRSKIRERLQEFALALEASEPYLPVRAVWLAWLGVDAVAGEDAVRTALVRDRLLSRLHRDGLRWDLDLPGFLRRARQNDAERMRELADEIDRIRRTFGEWMAAVTARKDRIAVGGDQRKGAAATPEYVRLIFAYADAALGQRERAEETLADAGGRLRATGDPVHKWLADAFEFRVREAFEGRRSFERLPASLMERIGELGRMEQLVVNRAREKLKLLEPHEEVASFAMLLPGVASDKWALGAVDATRQPNRAVRAKALRDLWEAAQRAPASERPLAETRVLTAAMSMGPDLGASQTDQYFKHLLRVLASTADSQDWTALAISAARAAAHFGRSDVMHAVVDQSESVLSRVGDTEELTPIEPLVGELFQDMRRFGLQGEITRLFRAAETTAANLETPKRSSKRKPATSKIEAFKREQDRALHLHRLELHIARGRFYFGQNDAAESILNRIERVLESNDPTSDDEKVKNASFLPAKQGELVQAYLRALSEAPSRIFMKRIQQLFRLMPDGRPAVRISFDAFAFTGTHFQMLAVLIAESLVRAMFSGDPTQSQESRRYVEEDEFYFRDRLHRDLAERLKRAQIG